MFRKIMIMLLGATMLTLMSGCVAYTPYYSGYGGYGYGYAAPVVPVPMFYGGGYYYGHHGHHRHHGW